MKFLSYLSLLLVFLLANCDTEKDNIIPTDGETYRINLTFNWTESNHTNSFGDFPNNAHFSPVIGSIHKNNHSFFRTGDLASPGIKLMAETGKISILSSEIDLQISQELVYDKFFAQGPASNSENKFISEIKAYKNYHFLSLVSMIAPSPDWFIATRNVNLKNEDGTWKDEITLDIHGYDSGTDSGEEFTSINNPTSPVEEIKRFEGGNDIVFAIATITKQ
jgi:hypothetical protein